MGFMWFTVGLITGLSVFVFVELHRRFDLNWLGWSGLILGEFLILFCIAWSTASVFEGVPRAASMGLLMFGGAGLVTLVLTWRLVVQKSARSGG
jgi:hypothetical protein